MRILVINTLPTEKNGISNVIFNLFSNISIRDNIKFGYVSNSHIDTYYANKINTYGIKSYVLKRSLSKTLSYVITLANIAKGYDIIHVHGNSATMALEMIAAKLAGVKIRIAHSHNTTCTNKLIDRILRPLFYALTNGRMACGEDAGKWLFKNLKFEIIKNGIDTTKFLFVNSERLHLRRKFGLDNNIVVGHVGNFISQKNHDFLIDVFYQIHKKNPHTILMLLGEGELMASIKQKVEKLHLSDNVLFMGGISNPEVYLNAMDIVIMPSFYEGLPLSMVEEQCNGLPILCSDTIAIEADLTGSVIFMNLNESSCRWADVALKLISGIDRSILLSQKNRDEIINKGYDIRDTSKKLLSLYYKSLQFYTNC